eukprot:2903109-Pleurochrysis_carterae.AAC.1
MGVAGSTDSSTPRVHGATMRSSVWRTGERIGVASQALLAALTVATAICRHDSGGGGKHGGGAGGDSG